VEKKTLSGRVALGFFGQNINLWRGLEKKAGGGSLSADMDEISSGVVAFLP